MVPIALREFSCVALLFSAVLAQEAKVPEPNAQEAKVDETTGFLRRTITVAGKEHRYAVFVPKGYRPTQRWPLIVFLHGMGESGTDGWRQTEVGIGAAIRADQERWPFVVLFPQKPDRASQWTDHEAMVLAILAEGEATYTIDPKRRFLTGLSQGGAGTWALGAKHADTWAAIAPVCGYGKLDEAAATKLKAMPIWAFHGVDDPVVPAQQSKDLCAAVTGVGGIPALTLYENTKHNSWDKAYRESALAEWLELARCQPWAAAWLSDPRLLDATDVELRLETRVGGDPPLTRTLMLRKIVGAFQAEDSGSGDGLVDIDRTEAEPAFARIVLALARGRVLAALANTPQADRMTTDARIVIAVRDASGQRELTAQFVAMKDERQVGAIAAAVEELRRIL